jgi:hypothetical protein
VAEEQVVRKVPVPSLQGMCWRRKTRGEAKDSPTLFAMAVLLQTECCHAETSRVMLLGGEAV